MSDTQVLEGIMLDGTQPPLVHLQAIKTVSLIISGYGGPPSFQPPRLSNMADIRCGVERGPAGVPSAVVRVVAAPACVGAPRVDRRPRGRRHHAASAPRGALDRPDALPSSLSLRQLI
jgi:hypothetical protein